MRVFVDLFMILNFFFDYFLLLSTSYLLKQYVKKHNLFFGALLGQFSIIHLFYPLSFIASLIMKAIVSLFMIMVTFKPKEKKALIINWATFLLNAMVLGGFLSFLKLQFSPPNALFLLILLLSPLFLTFYRKLSHQLRHYYITNYIVDLYFENTSMIKLNAYLDTGNQLYDPYHHRPVVLIKEDKIKSLGLDSISYIFVPYQTISEYALIKCIKVPKMMIDSTREYHDVLVGICESKMNLGNYDMLLHVDYKEEMK